MLFVASLAFKEIDLSLFVLRGSQDSQRANSKAILTMESYENLRGNFRMIF